MPRVLIVEDELDLAECLEIFFRARGFSVTCSFSGEEALEETEKPRAA